MPFSTWMRVVSCVVLVCGCAAYDGDKLGRGREIDTLPAPSVEANDAGSAACGNGRIDPGERCDISIPEGKKGACPDRCEAAEDGCIERALSGSGCRVQCVESEITRFTSGDGCCPDGADAADDADCGECGDSVVGPGEACDPPSSCPTPESCDGLAARCVKTRFSGSAEQCTARCEVIGDEISECRDDDACCPEECSSESDSDCSAQCGDGIVNEESGESCEPGASSRDCDVDCEDRNPCTRDVRSGSEANCNVRCTHVPIRWPLNADGCCPPAANAQNDSDCRPRCGNGVQEAGEECDGGRGCDADCRRVAAPDSGSAPDMSPAQCSELSDDRCARCGCSRCAEVRDACRDDGSRERNNQCRGVVDCGVSNQCIGTCSGQLGCFGRDCWFGSGYPLSAEGPCVDRIRAAAGGASEPSAVYAAALDEDFALYYAERYARCLRAECDDECGL